MVIRRHKSKKYIQYNDSLNNRHKTAAWAARGLLNTREDISKIGLHSVCVKKQRLLQRDVRWDNSFQIKFAHNIIHESVSFYSHWDNIAKAVTHTLLLIYNVVNSNSVHGGVYSIQHCVIKFVSDLRHVGGFLQVLRFPLPIKLTATI